MDSEIKKYLKRIVGRTEGLSKTDFKYIRNHILIIVKDKWINKEGEWDSELVNLFWVVFSKYIITLRNTTSSDSITINGIHFPIFNNKEYDSEKERNPNMEYFSTTSNHYFIDCFIVFKECKFYESADFSNFTFNKHLQFMGCNFSKGLNFDGSIFRGDLNLISNNFLNKGNIDIINTSLKEGGAIRILLTTGFPNLFIDKIELNGELDIQDSKLDKFHLKNKNTILHKNVIIKRTQFQRVDFFEVTFNMNLNFVSNTINEHFLIRDVNFNGISKFLNSKGEFNLRFESLELDENVRFVDFYLEKLKVKDTNLRNVSLLDCKWNSKERLIIENETTENEFGKSEVIYRQLKSNFENSKHYDLCAKAYQSELRMRHKKLFKLTLKKNPFCIVFSSSTYECILYWVYRVLSNYNRSVVRPLSLLILLTFFIGPLIYYYFESDIYYWGFKIPDNFSLDFWQEKAFTNIGIAFKKSCETALPILKNKEEIQCWVFQYTQSVISSILLTFFIIGVRNKMK